VEVVAHEDGEVARAVAHDLGRARVDLALEGLRVRDAEGRGDAASDRLEVLRRERDDRARVRDRGRL
jgi:hypothetical protein